MEYVDGDSVAQVQSAQLVPNATLNPQARLKLVRGGKFHKIYSSEFCIL